MRNPVDRLFERIPSPWRSILDWVLTIVIAVAAVLAIKAWVVNPYSIPSSSMEPTLHCAQSAADPSCEANRFSDRVLANRFIYHFKDPERGDIIVFETPAKAKEVCGVSQAFVKRLVALPGERFAMRDGVVFINGEPLDEPYLPDGTQETDEQGNQKERLIPDGQYFMMGDNRVGSCDSRVWGPVPRENIIGKVFALYWPPQRIGIR